MRAMLACFAAALITVGLFGCPGSGLDAGALSAKDAGASFLDAGVPTDAGPPPPRGPNVFCEGNGCLLSVEDWGDWSVEALLPFLTETTSIDNGYRLRRIVFRSQDRFARAVVAVPFQVSSPAGGWDLVINNPGTVGLADVCAVGEGVYGSGLAGLYGGRSLIGVAVDYPGLGTEGPHPYLVKAVEGRASLDAARAALQLVRWMGAAVSGQVAITGSSQGGHATFAAAAEAATYAPDLNLVAYAVAGPASVWLEHWQSGLSLVGSHHVYTTLLTWAWATHYGVPVRDVFAEPFLATLPMVLEDECLFGTTPTLFESIPLDPEEIFAPDYLLAWRSGDFVAWPEFALAWDENRVRPWPAALPLLVLQGAEDEVVLPASTQALVTELRAGGVEVDFRVIEGAQHINVAFNALALEQVAMDEALVWLRARFDDARR